MSAEPVSRESLPELGGVLDRNISTLLARRQRDELARPLSERIAARVTDFTGSMTFVYLHLMAFGTWIVVNLPFLPFPKFDPSYVVLAMFASVEAIFLSTLVLITQNRMATMADQRNELNLQISLLAEHEVTRVMTLVSEIARRMGIDAAHSPEIQELMRDVNPEAVLDRLDHLGKVSAGQSPPGT